MRYYDDFRDADSSGEPFAGYTGNVPEALGQVIVWFEDLDEQLASAVAFLLGQEDTVGRVVTAELSFKAKVNLFAALFRHRRPSSEYLDRLVELCGACLGIEGKRNQVVHSKWRPTLDGTGMTRTKTTARHHKHGLQVRSETLTPQQVEAIAMYCGYLAHHVDELMYLEFGREYGEP